MKNSVRDMMKMNVYEFAKEVLDIDLTPSEAHEHFLTMVEKLDTKYGAGNWRLCFGKRGNPVIVSVPPNLTDSLGNAVGNGGGGEVGG